MSSLPTPVPALAELLLPRDEEAARRVSRPPWFALEVENAVKPRSANR
jgi:hypothetical protein